MYEYALLELEVIYLEFERSAHSARWAVRRTTLPATDAGAPLLGTLAEDQRNLMVRRVLARPMGGPCELFRRGLEVQRKGPMDRLELPPPV